MVRYGNRCVNKILERCDTACKESGAYCRGYLCYLGCGEGSGVVCPDDLVCANGRYIVSVSKFLCEFVTSVSMVLVYVCY